MPLAPVFGLCFEMQCEIKMFHVLYICIYNVPLHWLNASPMDFIYNTLIHRPDWLKQCTHTHARTHTHTHTRTHTHARTQTHTHTHTHAHTQTHKQTHTHTHTHACTHTLCLIINPTYEMKQTKMKMKTGNITIKADSNLQTFCTS